MELDKAIERNEIIITKGELGDVLSAYPAIQLGIEALKREQYHRSCYPNQSPNLLPGETK